MKPYVSLGCSLTAQSGYVNYIKKAYNLEIENLSVSAGSNFLQIHKLNNLLIDKQVGNDTTLLWQITSPARQFEIHPRAPRQFKNGIPYVGIFDWVPEPVNLFKSDHTVFLCNNSYYDNKTTNLDYNMQSLLCDIYKWSKIVKRIIVYFGWSSMLPTTHIVMSMNFLNDLPNVCCLNLESSIVDWCRQNKLSFDDSEHPTEESYIRWAQQVLVPVLF